jgi:predicted ATPase/DNA-binding SARP family transcriptional activator
LTHLSHSFFGSWKVLFEDGTQPHFKYDKVRALLTYLVVESHQAHRRETLVDMFWPDLPEAAARNNLRQALAALKEALGDRHTDPPFLLADRASIQFNPQSDYCLDLDDFLRLLHDTNHHLHRRLESCRACIQKMQQAADLYRGHFLNDFYLGDSTAFEEWAALKREWLHQQALSLLGNLAALHERKSKFSHALQYVQRQLTLDPWREEAYRQAMRLHMLSGDREAALAAFEKCRRVLDEEMGVEPEPETTALYEQIRARETNNGTALNAQTSKTSVQHLTLPAERPHNLPPMATPFIGRETELEEIGSLIDGTAYRLVTLLGPGGSGKTRLAVQVGTEQIDSYTHGVFFISLAPLQSPELIPAAVLSGLGIGPDPKIAPLEKLLKHLRDKEMLLILDSFEHLIQGAQTIAAILRQAPEVTILVSSQARLNLHNEYVYRVEGFSPPAESASYQELLQNPAVQLFVQNAKRTQNSFKLTSHNYAHVAHICQLTAGLPLAIELASAWVHALSCKDIAAEISTSIGFLKTSLLDVPERHRSLTAVFDHSWQRLTPAEQDSLLGLSIFQGGFSRQAGEAAAGAGPALLAALVDKSLLRRNHSGRYEIHEMVRRYCLEKMESRGDLKKIHRLHAAFYLALTEEAEPNLIGPEQAAALDRLRGENDNIRYALASSLEDDDVETAARIASAIWRFWQTDGQISEARSWLDRILEKLEQHSARSQDQAGTSIMAPVYKAAGVMAWLQGDYSKSKQYFESGLKIYQQLGDHVGIATLYGNLGALSIHRADYQEAQALLEKALHLRRELDDKWSIASCLNNLGALAGRQGDLERAQTCYQECLHIFQELGYQSGIAISYSNLGACAVDLGDNEKAYSLHKESLTIRRKLGDKSGIAISLSDLGSIAYQQGDLNQASAHYAESLDLLREVGDKEHILDCLDGIARLASAREQYETAAKLWGSAEAFREEMNAPMSKSSLDAYTASVSAARGRTHPDTWSAAWEYGRRMNLEEAVAAALRNARERISSRNTTGYTAK